MVHGSEIHCTSGIIKSHIVSVKWGYSTCAYWYRHIFVSWPELLQLQHLKPRLQRSTVHTHLIQIVQGSNLEYLRPSQLHHCHFQLFELLYKNLVLFLILNIFVSQNESFQLKGSVPLSLTKVRLTEKR